MACICCTKTKCSNFFAKCKYRALKRKTNKKCMPQLCMYYLFLQY